MNSDVTSFELKSNLQVYPYFEKLTDITRYQAKRGNKLANHSCQFVYSIAS